MFEFCTKSDFSLFELKSPSEIFSYVHSLFYPMHSTCCIVL